MARVGIWVFEARAVDVRAAIGWTSDSDNRRLRDSLKRLATTLVRFERLQKDGSVNDAMPPLLSGASLPRGAGFIEWELPAMVRPHLAAPSVWTRLDLGACTRFSSRYALALYEHLSLKAATRHPVRQVGINEFRAFSRRISANGSWNELWRGIVEPALMEINECAPITATCNPIRDPAGRGRRIGCLAFRVARCGR